ncbi:MAG: ribonuclease III [Eubacteriales bacterium]|nr:ribonuclease III [Eubacteriales bacterium]
MKEYKHLQELEKRIGYVFQEYSWLETAMRHSSYANEKKLGHAGCNERLEFLGDAVLETISSEYLYDHYPDMTEGELTRLRASLVCEPTLAYDARQFHMEEFLLLGKGEEATGGRKRDSVVSDALEALIGAIFKDGGFEEARRFILQFIMNDVENKKLFHDSKTRLQEMIQAVSKEEIRYVIVSEKGPDHDKTFVAEVYLGERRIGRGEGRSKKAAEQNAAYEALVNRGK